MIHVNESPSNTKTLYDQCLSKRQNSAIIKFGQVGQFFVRIGRLATQCRFVRRRPNIPRFGKAIRRPPCSFGSEGEPRVGLVRKANPCRFGQVRLDQVMLESRQKYMRLHQYVGRREALEPNFGTSVRRTEAHALNFGASVGRTEAFTWNFSIVLDAKRHFCHIAVQQIGSHNKM